MQKRIENIASLSSSIAFALATRPSYARFNRASGFTLVELMVVVVIVAIFAAIAIPSYQSQVRKAQAAQAQQEIQRIASELERWKSRNFNYIGYNLTSNTVPNYSFTVTDGTNPDEALTDDAVAGQSWVIVAENADDSNYSFLMTSTGIQCKNKSIDNIEDNISSADNAGCGAGGETW